MLDEILPLTLPRMAWLGVGAVLFRLINSPMPYGGVKSSPARLMQPRAPHARLIIASDGVVELFPAYEYDAGLNDDNQML